MWNKTEPVRSYLYTLLAPVVALLVYYGILNEQGAPLWTAVAVAVLGVGATEIARAKVRPLVSLNRDRGTSLE